MAENGHDGRDAGDRRRLRRHRLRRRRRGVGRRGAAGRLRRLRARRATCATCSLPGGDAGVRNPCRMALSHLRTRRRGVGSRAALRAPRAPRRAGGARAATGDRAAAARRPRAWAGCSTRCRRSPACATGSRTRPRPRCGSRAWPAPRSDGCGAPYAFGLTATTAGPWQLDPARSIAAAAADVLAGVPAVIVAARFHLAVADWWSTSRPRLRDRTGVDTVALSGGVFLNVLLTTLCRATA